MYIKTLVKSVCALRHKISWTREFRGSATSAFTVKFSDNSFEGKLSRRQQLIVLTSLESRSLFVRKIAFSRDEWSPLKQGQKKMETKHRQIEFIRRQYLGGRNPLRTDRSKLGVKCFESAENWNYILSQLRESIYGECQSTENKHC